MFVNINWTCSSIYYARNTFLCKYICIYMLWLEYEMPPMGTGTPDHQPGCTLLKTCGYFRKWSLNGGMESLGAGNLAVLPQPVLTLHPFFPPPYVQWPPSSYSCSHVFSTMVDCIHGGHEPNKSFERCFLLCISNHNRKNETHAVSINTCNVYSFKHTHTYIYILYVCAYQR